MPSSSVSVTGKRGAGSGSGSGGSETRASSRRSVATATEPRRGDGTKRRRCTHRCMSAATGDELRRRRAARRETLAITGAQTRMDLRRIEWPEGSDRRRNPSLRERSNEGSTRWIARVLPTFLSKVRACTVRSATGLTSSGDDHRSGTVPGSHRLRDHAAYRLWTQPSTRRRNKAADKSRLPPSPPRPPPASSPSAGGGFVPWGNHDGCGGSRQVYSPSGRSARYRWRPLARAPARTDGCPEPVPERCRDSPKAAAQPRQPHRLGPAEHRGTASIRRSGPMARSTASSCRSASSATRSFRGWACRRSRSRPDRSAA